MNINSRVLHCQEHLGSNLLSQFQWLPKGHGLPQALKILQDDMQCDVVKIGGIVRNKASVSAHRFVKLRTPAVTAAADSQILSQATPQDRLLVG